MTVEQIVKYTALAKRRSELVLCSGSRWKPEYEKEMERLDTELLELRKEMIL